jgi:uncharacterized protein (TIGR00255 family)
MIRSMTGFGAARVESKDASVHAEVRSVNGRFLKVSMRLPARLASREHEMEALVRHSLRRGSVTLKVTMRHNDPQMVVAVNEEVVRAYQEVFRRLGIPEAPLATLPGVLGGEPEEVNDEAFALVRQAVTRALEALGAMRGREGAALAEILGGLCDAMERLAAEVRERAPRVVGEYRARLQTRLQQLVEGFGSLPTDAAMVAREVALLAERCDVTEELDRIAGHLAQVRELLAHGDEAGRTLEFLGQELLREANTIGSKSADAQMTHLVVQLKAELERFREQLANVE